MRRVFAVIVALLVLGAVPAPAQQERTVDWGAYAKDAPQRDDADWEAPPRSGSDASRTVDWTTFSAPATDPDTGRDTDRNADREQGEASGRPAAGQVAPAGPTPGAEEAEIPGQALPAGELRYRVPGASSALESDVPAPSGATRAEPAPAPDRIPSLEEVGGVRRRSADAPSVERFTVPAPQARPARDATSAPVEQAELPPDPDPVSGKVLPEDAIPTPAPLPEPAAPLRRQQPAPAASPQEDAPPTPEQPAPRKRSRALETAARAPGEVPSSASREPSAPASRVAHEVSPGTASEPAAAIPPAVPPVPAQAGDRAVSSALPAEALPAAEPGMEPGMEHEVAAFDAVPDAAPPRPAQLAAPPRRLYSDAVVRHFLRLALYDRDALLAAPGGEARAQVLVRWEQPMRVAVLSGDASASAVVAEAVEMLSRAVPSQQAGIALAGPDEATARVFVLGGDGGGIDGYTERIYRDGQVLTGARIVLYQDSLTPAVAVRELLRALGFTGCAGSGESLMRCRRQDAAPGGALPELDRLALKMLYHPALEPGMDLERTRRAVETLR